MIDIHAEGLIPLREVPRLIPRRPNGKKVHTSTIYRWARGGSNGRRLDTVRIGGTTYTSGQALQRFAEGGGDRLGPSDESGGPKYGSLRRRQIERAAADVAEILGDRRGWEKSRRGREAPLQRPEPPAGVQGRTTEDQAGPEGPGVER